MTVDQILERFQRFGVHLGLERIENLLACLGNPHHQVPIIHVAGTNGKGSVCAYLSSILTQAGYRVGRYISPHLVDWTERICINEQPISRTDLERVLLEVEAAIDPNQPSPTQFEVITAAAWLYFAQQQVDIAVIEVGLGGRLDATNVCDRPLVSAIVSISREHWQRLGPTVAHIAREKAGVLKAGCPAVIGKLPPDAQAVVEQRINELDCPAVWVEAATATHKKTSQGLTIAIYQDIEYPLPLLGQVQLINSAIAIAAIKLLQQQRWQISSEAIWQGMTKTRWLGRLQWTNWRDRRLLVDGAHNPAAAQVLRQYIDSINPQSVEDAGVNHSPSTSNQQPITWVMGMLSTKDHADIFEALLRPGDQLYLVPVPDHSSAEPEQLAALSRQICPSLARSQAYPDLIAGLEAAVSSASSNLVVLCGSLYLVGYFLSLQNSTVS
ncbi:bifunctional folylpolyglutamate synthase/dihydrofolate synthase [Capilliphycus salinus ALCB114379]|uniref:bifunctional folylpolyglutamate synthase/dihydrofolate synthase n=1 Tax=Capilliphycus salinus TaxID=2768948 RepID=UPI0039A753B4